MDCQSDFITTVQLCLNEGRTDDLLNLLNEKSNHLEIETNNWELISIVCKFLDQTTKENNIKTFECCKKVLDHIALQSSPEECLLQFIEEFEFAKDDTTFLSLLNPMQVILSRIPDKRHNSFAWCFDAIQKYLGKLKLPNNLFVENEERVFLEIDPTVDRIIQLLSHGVLPFYEKLLPRLTQESQQQAAERKLILSKFLVNLLDHPLANLDMEITGNNKSRTRHVAEYLCKCISIVLPDPIKLVEIDDENQENAAYFKATNRGQAVLFYLIYGEEILLHTVPKVYDPVYVFQTYIHLIPQLFDNNNQFLVSKGLKLAKAFLNRLVGFELPYLLLDSESHSEFCKKLSLIIIYNNLEIHRKQSFEILGQYLHNFETRGRYLIIYNLVKVVNHSGLIGYLITSYKNMLNEALVAHMDDLPKYFKGQMLYNILTIFCHLHKDEQSDLVELSDQIIATLNLLRYLALRDKKNVTGIWDHFKQFEKSYFEPLKKGLMLSRAHYQQKIQDVKNESEKNKKISNITVSVGGQDLPDMPINEKIKVLQSALTCFDVMESLLGRLTEIIEAK